VELAVQGASSLVLGSGFTDQEGEMEINALEYIGINATRGEEWVSYATGLWGMRQVDCGASTRAFRMDDRKQRLVVTGAVQDGLGFMGWKVADAAALDTLAARLDAAPIRFHDTAGNLIEACVPGRSISGLKTGAMGLGHAVLTAINVDALLLFYVNLLGFNISDYIRKPFLFCFLPLQQPPPLLCHAMPGLVVQGFHHFMVEYDSLDDVGQGYDLALPQEGRLAFTLDRHANDYMTRKRAGV
jgi:catechol 2,3-dioxygenase-like lactoylglutathione lyase family enzyme